MKTTFKGREVEVELSNISYDHDYWCDAIIESAYYIDTEVDLTTEELEELYTLGIDGLIIDYLY